MLLTLPFWSYGLMTDVWIYGLALAGWACWLNEKLRKSRTAELDYRGGRVCGQRRSWWVGQLRMFPWVAVMVPSGLVVVGGPIAHVSLVSVVAVVVVGVLRRRLAC